MNNLVTNLNSAVALSLFVIVLSSLALSQASVPSRFGDQILVDGSGQYQQGFGKQVAVDGEWMAIANYLDSSVSQGAGSVHIFRKSPDGYEFFQVVHPDPLPSQSVALLGLSIKNGVLAMPAPAYPNMGIYGTVYVFEFDGFQWVRSSMLFPGNPNGQLGGGFGVGTTVVDSETILVGAPLDPVGPINTTIGSIAYEQYGAVYIFRKLGMDWVNVQKLKLTHPAISAGNARGWAVQAGWRMDADGDLAIIGGRQDIPDLLLAPMFHANVIERDANGWWSEVDHIEHPNGHFLEDYTESVAIEGDLIAIGAPVHAASFFQRPGYVYLYRNGASGWEQEAVLEASDSTVTSSPGGTESDRFGYAVDIEGGRVIVGARRAYPDRGQKDLGSGYLFEKRNGIWEEVERLWTQENDPNPQRPQMMGQAVALIGDIAIVSDDLGSDGNTWGAGSVHVFFLPFGDSTCAGQANSTGEAAWIEAVGSRKVVHEHLVLRSGSVPDGFAGYLLAGTQSAFYPGVGGGMGDLCLGGALARFRAQAQISANGKFEVDVNVTQIPTVPTSSILAGDTWHFQFWYRDFVAGSTSNLSEAVAVIFH